MSLGDWCDIESVIVAKFGMLSFLYYGIRSYVPFIIALTLSIVAVYFIDKVRSRNRIQPGKFSLGSVSVALYVTIATAYVGVALYDLGVQIYAEQSIPKEDHQSRLIFLLGVQHVAMENFIKYLALLSVPVLVLLKKQPHLLHTIYQKSQVPLGKTTLVAVFVLVSIMLSAYLNSVSFGLSYEPTIFTLKGLTERLYGLSPSLGFVYPVIMIPLIAISEEQLFRGVIYSSLREKIGIIPGSLLASALFSVYHGVSPWALHFLVAGICLALLYEGTGSIYPPIVVHGSILALSVLAGVLF